MKNCIIPADQNARFNGTIICYKKIPYYVSMDGNTMRLYKLETINSNYTGMKAAAINVNPYDDDVDISSIPLGYVNLPAIRSVVYLMRRPVRRFRQGISEETVTFGWLPDHVTSKQPERVYYRTRDILYTAEFENAVLEQYPTLDEAFETLKGWAKEDDRGEVALSRDVALSINKVGIINVYYKNELVGWIASGKKVVNVPSNEMGWIISLYLSGFRWEIR